MSFSRLLPLLGFWFSSLGLVINFPASMSSVDTGNRQGYDSFALF